MTGRMLDRSERNLKKADVDELAASSGLAHLTLLFGSRSSPLLMYLTVLLGKTAPGWTVYSNVVPRVNVDVKGFQRSLESVLEALLLPTN